MEFGSPFNCLGNPWSAIICGKYFCTSKISEAKKGFERYCPGINRGIKPHFRNYANILMLAWSEMVEAGDFVIEWKI